MSRMPVRGFSRSNGHGRGGRHELVVGRPGNLIVEARLRPMEIMKDELLKRARDFGLDHAVVIRRIAEEDTQEEGEDLADPILLYRVSVADGREQLVRNAEFSGVTLRALRDVAAAGGVPVAYNYRDWGPYRFPRDWVPASIVTPSLIISEMELRKADEKPDKPPYLPHPSFVTRPKAEGD